jgi:acyl-CoA synthetase (AMP-forming)/AMP-acid ligase II
MSSPQTPVGEHHLARLAERAYERRGDYPSMLYEGDWLHSGEIFTRSRRIGGYKHPREVHFVEAIPLTAVGKIDRKALRGLRDA